MSNHYDKAIEQVLAKERHYNILKTVLIVTSLLLALVYIGYQVNSAANNIKRDNKKTREYIHCVVDLFAHPTGKVINLDSCQIQESVMAKPPTSNLAVAPPPVPHQSASIPTIHVSSVPSFTTVATPSPVPPTPPPQKEVTTTPPPALSLCPTNSPIEYQTILGVVEYRCKGDLFWQN